MLKYFKGLPGPTQTTFVICAAIVLMAMVFLVVFNQGALVVISGLLFTLVNVYQMLTGKETKE